MTALDSAGNMGFGELDTISSVSSYRTFENAGTNGTLTLLDDNKHMKATKTSECYGTTGISFDISDAGVGKEHDFEVYRDDTCMQDNILVFPLVTKTPHSTLGEQQAQDITWTWFNDSPAKRTHIML